jgi:S-DNA-T family DNA segregation ATPase FtsK/SpoIIIE
MCPVVTDMKRAATILEWAVEKMEARYHLLHEAGVRNIYAYNKLGEEKLSKRLEETHGENFERSLPFIVIVIDELADLMMLAGQVIEKLICRIAQLSRAVGIHLVIATQRPDVKVITGTIKANVPSRVAFATVSYIDSRTILDGSGAEKLLGSGDMLFAPIGENVPLRVQGAYLADDEIDRVVEWCRGQADAHYDESITQFELDEESGGGEAGDGRDEFFNEAADIVRSTGRASTSFLQRRLKIGYNRAARIMEELEDAQIVSPPDHAGNRKVL